MSGTAAPFATSNPTLPFTTSNPTSPYSSKTLAPLTISNGPLVGTVIQAVRQADLDYTVTEASQFTFAVADDSDLTLLRSGFLGVGTVLGNGGGTGRYWTVVRSSLGGTSVAPVLTATAQPHQVVTMRSWTGARTWLKTSPSQVAWGEAKSAGCAASLVEPTPVRASILRVLDGTTNESSWDLIVRLAGETGSLAFVDGNTFYFGRPTWLAERMPWRVIDRAQIGGWFTEMPTFSESTLDGSVAATASCLVQRGAAGQFRLGQVVVLTGWGRFDRAWLVGGYAVSLDDVTPATLSLIAPVDPPVQDPALANPPRTLAARWRLTYPTVTIDPQAGRPFIWPLAGEVRASGTAGAQVYGLAGQSVYAPAAGRVTWVANGATQAVEILVAAGWAVRIEHIAALTLRTGQRVTRGVRIGQLPPAGASDPYVNVATFQRYQLEDPVTSEKFPDPKPGTL